MLCAGRLCARDSSLMLMEGQNVQRLRDAGSILTAGAEGEEGVAKGVIYGAGLRPSHNAAHIALYFLENDGRRETAYFT